MLDLQSSEWVGLTNAFDDPLSVPIFLDRLNNANPTISPTEWSDFISSLCCGGELFPASFAAFPHLVSLAARKIPNDRVRVLLTAGLIEFNRRRSQATVPPKFAEEYFSSLQILPKLSIECLAFDWSAEELRIIFATLASVRGKLKLAALLLDGASTDEQGDLPEET